MDISAEDIAALDARHIWHPYAEPGEPTLVVDSAAGVYLTLADGTTLIDAMSSWWAAAHGHTKQPGPTGVEGAGGSGGHGRASRRGAERSEAA